MSDDTENQAFGALTALQGLLGGQKKPTPLSDEEKAERAQLLANADKDDSGPTGQPSVAAQALATMQSLQQPIAGLMPPQAAQPAPTPVPGAPAPTPAAAPPVDAITSAGGTPAPAAPAPPAPSQAGSPLAPPTVKSFGTPELRFTDQEHKVLDAYRANPGDQNLQAAAAGVLRQAQSRAPTEAAQQAEAQFDSLVAREQKSRMAANAAAGAAATGHAQAIVDVDKRETGELAKIDQEYHTARLEAHMKSMEDSHRWLTKLDELVRKEPDPARIFHSEGGGLRKGLWLASIIAGSFASRRNPQQIQQTLQMLRQTMQDDVKRQSEQLGRETDVAKMHLASGQAEYAQSLADLKDDRAQETTRWLAMSRYLRDKAALPGPADMKAANLATANMADQEAVKLGDKVREDAYKMRDQELTRQKDYDIADAKNRAEMDRERLKVYNENARAKAQREMTAGISEEGKALEAKEARQEGLKTANKMLLAPVEAGAKESAKIAAESAPLNDALGVRDLSTGKSPVMRKEQHDKAGVLAAESNQIWRDMHELKKELEGIGPSDYVAGNPKLDSIRKKVQLVMAKKYHGGGRVSESFVKGADEVATGMSPTWAGRSFQEIRGQVDMVRDVVNRNIATLKGDTDQDLSALSTGNEKLDWSPRDLEPKTTEPVSVTQQREAAGLPTSAGVGINRPVTVKDLEAVDAGKRPDAPKLSAQATQALEDAKQTFGWSVPGSKAGMLPDDILEQSKAYAKGIRDYGFMDARHRGPGLEIPESEDEDAARRMELGGQRDANIAREHLGAVLKAQKDSTTRSYTKDDFMEMAQKKGGFNVKDQHTYDGLSQMYDDLNRSDRFHPDVLQKLIDQSNERFR